MKVSREFDEATGNWLAPAISLSTDTLRNPKISVFKHWIDITTGELEIEFHQTPPYPIDVFNEMMKERPHLYVDDLFSAEPHVQARLKQLNDGYDEFLRDKLTKQLENLGIPVSAQDVRALQTGKGYWLFVCRLTCH